MTYKFIFLNLILGLFILSACGIKGQLPQNNNVQSPSKGPIDSIAIAHKQFDIDQFDALYIVSPNDELLKLKTNNQVEFQYSNSRFGPISSIDIRNPLTTLCFYKDFQTITLLDRTLSPLSEIDLGDWGLSNVTAVCGVGNNQLWVYDASEMQLVQISKDRTTPIRTFPINLNTDTPIVFTKMLINQEHIYCLSAKGDICKISLIGETLQKLTAKGLFMDFRFSGNRLLLLDKQGQIYHYKNPLELQLLNYPLAQKSKWAFQNPIFMHGNGQVIWKTSLNK